ncbi:hypothetical protein H2200_004857 [Cladophialophora chaetospira]|uniref:Uncharacterized protein n=1 Tax=Cladophialophora chaetospira TaxID=386627 RepID=A0AA39CKJ8_9EURO|nr:hypothetical protein H2200_004857 [Cladophialophora chaetospira]
MFASTQARVIGAPEILDGSRHSAPRSWNNLRRWSIRKDEHIAGHQEQERSGTSSTDATADDNHKVARQRRRRHRGSAPTFKHLAIFLAFSIPIVFLALVIKIPAWYAFEAEHWDSTSFTHCNFNGDFTLSDKPTVGLWDPRGFFYITVSWGKMAFSTAKCIDIVWDIVVGRGGQALLVFVTFKVSSQYLALAMRKAPVSYNTFEALAFVPPTVVRTSRLAGDLLTNRGWRARVIIVWIILSSLFVLSFSSWITAMSGYSSNIDAVMPNYDNESVMWSNFTIVQFAINDAERLGHPGPLFITVGQACVQEGFLNDDAESSGTYHDMETSAPQSRRRRDDDDDENTDGGGDGPWEYVPANCTSFWRTVQYVSTYGLSGKNDSESMIILNGTTTKLSAPSLNITTSYSPATISALTTYLNTWSESSPPASTALRSVSQPTNDTFWIYDDDIYPFSYVHDNAACQYSKWHNWGFSFLFLFIASLLLAIWSVGTFALWLYVHLHTPHDEEHGRYSTGGIYRSSFTLVEAMNRDAGPGSVTSAKEEQEIRDLVRRRHGRVIFGVGSIDDHSPRMPSEREKTFSHSPAAISPAERYPRTRWDAFRNWLSPRSRSHPHHTGSFQSPANSVFTHADSTYSSTSQHPILQSASAPGRTMTMTSRLSSLASPFTESPPEFGFSAADETNILDEADFAATRANSVSLPPEAGQHTGRKRPRLSLSRAIRSSTNGGNAPRTASLLSASSTTGKWVTSPGPVTPSEDSLSTISPIQEREKGNGMANEDENDAVRWRNDLGDD